MENGDFNLESAIKMHVQQVQQRGSIMPEDAAELSAHLYDATEALIKQQLSIEEAFLIAAKRLGNNDVLHEEYSKVNMSVNINRIWSYMIIGFNLLYAIPSILHISTISISNWILYTHSASSAATVVVTGLNLIVCFAIIYVTRQKHKIAGIIERSVEKQALRTVAWSFLPVMAVILAKTLSPIFIAPKYTVLIPSAFESTWVEMSFYLRWATLAFAALSMVVSISKFEKLSFKTIFEKPTFLFLIITGTCVEFLAASTRIIHISYLHEGIPFIFSTLFSMFLFGLIYMVPALLISYYNNHNQWKYLLAITFFGLAIELGLGCMGGFERFNTIYHILTLVAGTLLGKNVGNHISRNYYATN